MVKEPRKKKLARRKKSTGTKRKTESYTILPVWAATHRQIIGKFGFTPWAKSVIMGTWKYLKSKVIR